ncbi:MAG: AzlC family ABC transporter permease [Actinomycetota bacterium]|nr:AzlC family ABC transporter permease [Actinomycetota bacterium]
MENRKTYRFLESFKAALPIGLGYIPLGLACGMLGQKVGISPLAMGAMSLIVFAGGAQFIAISLIGAKVPPFSIILATGIINLRHILMSSALADYLNDLDISEVILFSHGVTDETFAVNHNRFERGGWGYENALLLNVISHFFWISGNVAGALAGGWIVVDIDLASFALTAMFVALLVLCIKELNHLLTALFAFLSFKTKSFAISLSLGLVAFWLIGRLMML